jgi:hypothetical protein
MREITVKYQGECKKCGQSLEIGQPAMYEKSIGIFCIGCEPKEVEEIRAFRLAKAERKAEKYEEWAEKREHKANAQLNSHSEIQHDWAFITQPGHIPFRAKMIKADDRAFESLNVAEGFRNKAENLRHVQVKGDAERRYQAQRDANDLLIHKGSRITDIVFGEGTVVSIYKKSYRIQWDKSGHTWAREKSFVNPII